MMSITHTFLYGLESWGSALKGSYYDLVTHTFIECGYGLGYNYTYEIFRENGYHLYQMVVKEAFKRRENKLYHKKKKIGIVNEHSELLLAAKIRR